MNKKFAASEIVEIGIQIEKNGKEFYTTIANNTQNTETANLFRYLSDEEKKHITAFSDIFYSVSSYDPVQSYPDEYFSYMNKLASDHVFTQKDKGVEIALQIKDESEAIEIAIKFEKDSIVFYTAMKDMLLGKDSTLIDRLIEEEEKHLTKLVSLKTELNL